MLPIRDHNPSGRTPYVTYALIVINLIIFVAFNLSLGEGRALNLFFYIINIKTLVSKMLGDTTLSLKAGTHAHIFRSKFSFE